MRHAIGGHRQDHRSSTAGRFRGERRSFSNAARSDAVSSSGDAGRDMAVPQVPVAHAENQIIFWLNYFRSRGLDDLGEDSDHRIVIDAAVI